MKRPLLTYEPDRVWRNWHNSSRVGGNVERFYTPRNVWEDGSRPSRKAFLPGLRGLQQIIRRAERDQKQVRALGSGWSLSNVAYSDEYLINTARLTYWFVGFNTASMVTPRYQNRRHRLVYAQCGVQIRNLNAHLESRRLSLPTSGASNGQTIAGALATGTHGSANSVGSMQDFMLALHVVAEGGKHYLIQRRRRQAVTTEFCRWLGAERICDDDLFRAAVVSFGSFGVVHGVLFEAKPIYLLERHVKQFDFDDVRAPMASLDVSTLGLKDGDALPFHFEVVLNPYRSGPGERGAFVRVLYKRKAGRVLPTPDVRDGGLLRSEDLVALVGHLSDVLPVAVPPLLQSELEGGFAPTPPSGVLLTHGQQFGDSTPTGGGTSTEIGVPMARVGEAVRVVLQAAQQEPFGAPIALRYVKASDAFLAFTRFGPRTCTIELPGVDSRRTREGFERIWRALRDRGIPHTFHWGQALPMEPTWVPRQFGARRTRWLEARRAFLSARGRAMFSNRMVERLGLSS